MATKDENDIHPTAVVYPGVSLGSGNSIGPFSVLYGGITLGNNNHIGAHTVIGSLGVDTHIRRVGGGAGLRLGDSNRIAEFASIKQGQVISTQIGNGAVIGSHVSIGHDSQINDECLALAGAVISGACVILERALIGLQAAVRPGVVVGAFATVASHTVAYSDVPPIALKTSGRPPRTNLHNLPERHAIRPIVENVSYQDLDWSSPELAALMTHYDKARVAVRHLVAEFRSLRTRGDFLPLS